MLGVHSTSSDEDRMSGISELNVHNKPNDDAHMNSEVENKDEDKVMRQNIITSTQCIDPSPDKTDGATDFQKTSEDATNAFSLTFSAKKQQTVASQMIIQP